MDLGLAGKIAIVTGGGSGIGKAICMVLAAEGAQVAVVDLYRRRAEDVAHEIGNGSRMEWFFSPRRGRDTSPGRFWRSTAAISWTAACQEPNIGNELRRRAFSPSRA